MELTDAQRVRYARHLLLPELGETGQLRLLASVVCSDEEADAGALDVARDYLTRAGVRLSASREEAAVLALPTSNDVARLAGAPELIEVAQALSGAFAAVEAIKAAVGIGRAGALPAALALASEEV